MSGQRHMEGFRFGMRGATPVMAQLRRIRKRADARLGRGIDLQSVQIMIAKLDGEIKAR